MRRFLLLKSNSIATPLELQLQRQSWGLRSSLLKLFLLVASAFWISCATKPVYKTEVHEGTPTQLEAKAYFQNLRTGKSHVVNLDIIAVKPEKARFEVSSGFGIHLASLVIDKNKVAYTLNREAKFFEGPRKPQALVPLLSVPLNPDDLLNMVFDAPVRGVGWKCESENNLVKICSHAQEGLVMTWSDRKGDQRSVEIKSEAFQIKLLFQSLSTKVEISERTFVLQPPEEYKRYRL